MLFACVPQRLRVQCAKHVYYAQLTTNQRLTSVLQLQLLDQLRSLQHEETEHRSIELVTTTRFEGAVDDSDLGAPCRRACWQAYHVASCQAGAEGPPSGHLAQALTYPSPCPDLCSSDLKYLSDWSEQTMRRGRINVSTCLIGCLFEAYTFKTRYPVRPREPEKANIEVPGL